MMDVKEKRLFEDITRQVQQAHDLNPLGSQILACLLLDVKDEGISFDALVSMFKASKSSISTSLQLLVQLNFVESMNKIGSRKRYFRLKRDQYLQLRLQQVLDFINKERDITDRFIDFADPSSNTKLNKKLHVYQQHLELAIENLETTLSRLKNIPE